MNSIANETKGGDCEPRKIGQLVVIDGDPPMLLGLCNYGHVWLRTKRGWLLQQSGFEWDFYEPPDD